MTAASISAAKSPVALPAATQGDAAALGPLSRGTQPAELLLARSEQSSRVSEFGEQGGHAPARARKTEGVAPGQSDSSSSPVPGTAAAGAMPTVRGKPIGDVDVGTLEVVAKLGTPILKAAAVAELARRAAVVALPSATVQSENAATSGQVPPEIPPASAVLPQQSEAQETRDNRTERAATWLQELLSAGPVLANEGKRQGSAAGFSRRTLERAAARLGVRRQRPTFGGAYTWALPMLANETTALARQDGPTVVNGEHVAAALSRDAEREVALP